MLSQKNFSNFSFTTANVDARKTASYKRRIERAQTKLDRINQYLEKVVDCQMKLKKISIALRDKLDSQTLPQDQISSHQNALDAALEQLENLTLRYEKEISKILTLTARVFTNKHKLAKAEILSNYGEEENDSKDASPSA